MQELLSDNKSHIQKSENNIVIIILSSYTYRYNYNLLPIHKKMQVINHFIL